MKSRSEPKSKQLVIPVTPTFIARLEAAARRRRMLTGENWSRSSVASALMSEGMTREEAESPKEPSTGTKETDECSPE
jgi:hypothetical protein